MLVVGALLITSAVFCVVAGLTAAVFAWSARRLLRRMRRAARPALGDLELGDRLPRRVLITGRVVPGADGVLASPAFDTRCVWYRTVVRRDGDDDSISGVPVLDLCAGGPTIRISDGSGSVEVDAELLLRGSPRTAIGRTAVERVELRRGVPPPAGSGLARLERNGLLPRRAYPRFGGHSVSVSEETVARGVELSVVARPRRSRSGTVMLRRGALAAGPSRDWISEVEEDAGSALGIARVLMGVGPALFALGAAVIWVVTGWPSFDW